MGPEQHVQVTNVDEGTASRTGNPYPHRMPGSRHTRPRRRRDLAEAYGQVQREVTSLRATVRLDSYEIDRLLDVIARLHADVQRLSTQLLGVRREIAAIRVTGQTDPLVQILAEQASELRAQLTASRLAMATMTSVPLPATAPVVAAHPPNGMAQTPVSAPAAAPVTSLRPFGSVPVAASDSPVVLNPVSASPEFDQLRQERPSLSKLIGVAAPHSGYAAKRRIAERKSAEGSSVEGSAVEGSVGADEFDEFDEASGQLVDITAETIRLIRTSLDR